MADPPRSLGRRYVAGRGSGRGNVPGAPGVGPRMQIIYTAEATAWGGREGRAASSDGVVDVQLAIPKEMGGPGGPLTNPEQLFATGYAACFHSALKLVASQEKVDVSESAVTARVGIGPGD